VDFVAVLPAGPSAAVGGEVLCGHGPSMRPELSVTGSSVQASLCQAPV